MDAQETTTTEAEALSPDGDSAVTMVVRKRELTPKALEEMLNSLIRSRRCKLGQLTAKLKDIEHLLSNEEEWSPDITTVQRELKAYGEIYQEFVAFNLVHLVPVHHQHMLKKKPTAQLSWHGQQP